MSSGRGSTNVSKTLAQFFKVARSGDTAEMMAQWPPQIIEDYDIPDAAGISVDRKRCYIDRGLAKKIRSGEITVRGMTADQIIIAIALNEHGEITIVDGDNQVDTYWPAHELITPFEHWFVILCGALPSEYEDALAPGIAVAEAQDPENPPLDPWCGPYLEDPDENDLRVLKILRAKGVVDAFKQSKKSLHYGVGEEECQRCTMYHSLITGKPLGLCDIVCGMVRWDRHCDEWQGSVLIDAQPPVEQETASLEFGNLLAGALGRKVM